MTTTQQALKMAQQALSEALNARVVLWKNGCDCGKEHTCNPLKDHIAKQCDDAIGAIIKAFEQQEQEPVAWTSEYELKKCTTKRYPASFWRNQYKTVGNTIPLYTHPAKRLSDDEASELVWEIIKLCGRNTGDSDINVVKLHKYILELFNRPAKQLSDDEIAEIYKKQYGDKFDVIDFDYELARAIETKIRGE